MIDDSEINVEFIRSPVIRRKVIAAGSIPARLALLESYSTHRWTAKRNLLAKIHKEIQPIKDKINKLWNTNDKEYRDYEVYAKARDVHFYRQHCPIAEQV